MAAAVPVIGALGSAAGGVAALTKSSPQAAAPGPGQPPLIQAPNPQSYFNAPASARLQLPQAAAPSDDYSKALMSLLSSYGGGR